MLKTSQSMQKISRGTQKTSPSLQRPEHPQNKNPESTAAVDWVLPRVALVGAGARQRCLQTSQHWWDGEGQGQSTSAPIPPSMSKCSPKAGKKQENLEENWEACSLCSLLAEGKRQVALS